MPPIEKPSTSAFFKPSARLKAIALAPICSNVVGTSPELLETRALSLDEVEKVLRGDAEQSCISLALRHLDAKDRGPIHPGKGLEITAVIEDRYVLGNANFLGFRS